MEGNINTPAGVGACAIPFQVVHHDGDDDDDDDDFDDGDEDDDDDGDDDGTGAANATNMDSTVYAREVLEFAGEQLPVDQRILEKYRQLKRNKAAELARSGPREVLQFTATPPVDERLLKKFRELKGNRPEAD